MFTYTKFDTQVEIAICTLCFTGVKPTLVPVYTTLEKYENDGVTLNTHKIFPFQPTPEEFKNATNTGHFGFALYVNSMREITRLS